MEFGFIIFCMVIGFTISMIWMFSNMKNKSDNFIEIKPIGKVLDMGNPGGRLGMKNYSIGLLSFEIYSDEIMISSKLVGSDFAIKKEDIVDVKYEKGLLGTKQTVIKHISLNFQGDVILYCVIDKSLLLGETN